MRPAGNGADNERVAPDTFPHPAPPRFAGADRQQSALPFPPPVPRVVTLTAELWCVATVIGGLRRAENLGGDRGNRPSGHGAKREDVSDTDGAAGELTISHDVNLAWTGILTRRVDVPDVGRRIEVRTTRWPRGHLIVQDDDPADALCVLVIVDPPRMTLPGWLVARDARQDRWKRKNRDGGPVWYVPQSALRPYDRTELRRLDALP